LSSSTTESDTAIAETIRMQIKTALGTDVMTLLFGRC